MNINKRHIYEQLAAKKISVQDAMELLKQSRANADLVWKFAYGEPYLRDHTVFGEQVLLGVTHGSLAIESAKRSYPQEESALSIKKLLFMQPMVVKPEEHYDVRIQTEERAGRILFKSVFKEKRQSTYTESASGEFFFEKQPPFNINLSPFKQENTQIIPGNQIYGKSAAIVHGPSLQTVKNVYVSGDQSIGELNLTASIKNNSESYHVHPALLDGAIVSAMPVFSKVTEVTSKVTFIPLLIKQVVVLHALPDICYAHVNILKTNSEVIVADIQICDPEGFGLVSLKEFTLKRVEAEKGFLKKVNSAPRVTPKSIPVPNEVRHKKPQKGNAFSNKNWKLQDKIENFLIEKISTLLPEASQSLTTVINFMDLGVDSNRLVTFAQDIEREFGIELYPTLFFEYQNIKELAKYFFDEHRETFITILGGETSSISDISNDTTDQERSEPDVPYASKEDGIPSLKSAETNGALHYQQTKSDILVSPRSGQKQALPEKDIAVIGMAGKFAKSPDLNHFWENIVEQKNLITEIPTDHFDYRPYFSAEPSEGKTYCKWGSFIDDVDKFDADFFRISPREAEVMDPQLRYLLQIIQATAEDAGYANQIRGSKTGMYVGVCFHDYMNQMMQLGIASPYSGTGNAATMMANRPSFNFDLTGPSIAVDTACSSSLVALHLACRGLQHNECDMAFAAGTNLLLNVGHYIYFCSIGALSFTGRCHTFDKRSDGYVPGEGVAAVLLKPLKKAIADQDRIYAVIKGSAVNHGGYTPSITAPSVKLEAQVILDAWEDAGIDPETIGYIEAHGTGTKLGDPIETEAIKRAFKKFTRKEGFCRLGSAKAHIGHTEGVAGIAGVVKAILSMKNKTYPAMPMFEALNDYIKLDRSPLYINQEAEVWKRLGDSPRRAGVSSFGFGGAYGHVVIEDYEEQHSEKIAYESNTTVPVIILLSARDEERLKDYVINMISFLENGIKDKGAAPQPQLPSAGFDSDPPLNLNDIAYTLQVGREAMTARLAIVIHDKQELIEKLNRYLKGESKIDRFFTGTKEEKKNLRFFDSDEDAHVLIDNWVKKGKYENLAEIWTEGIDIDWTTLYPGSRPRRISLPTYPFAKERHWVGPSNVEARLPNQKENRQENHKTLYHCVVWDASGLKTTDLKNSKIDTLLLFENGHIGEPLRDRIASKYKESKKFNAVILIQAGHAYSATDQMTYTIDVSNPDNYKQLFSDLKTANFHPRAVLVAHTTLFSSETAIYKDADSAQSKSIFPVKYLMKALLASHLNSIKRFLVIFNEEADGVDPFMASISAFGGSLRMVMPHLTMTTIRYADAWNNDSIAATAVNELESNQCMREIRYFKGVRFVRRVKPVDLPRDKQSPFKNNGLYLITGGLGAIGRVIARYLATHYAARLVLTGRSDLTSAQNTAGKQLEVLRQLGVEVTYLQADVTNFESMQTMVATVKKEIGDLDGVIHAAGKMSENLFQDKDDKEFAETLRPKIAGTLILDEVTKNEALDLFLLFSSTSAILGDFGQCDYAVGNHFLDEFVSVREQMKGQNARHGRTLSINWPVWREGRMHLPEEFEDIYLKSSGMTYLESSDGIEALETILKNDFQQILVIKGEPQRVANFMERVAGVTLMETLEKTTASAQSQKFIPQSSRSMPLLQRLEADIRQIAARILNTEPKRLRIEENLGNFGFESITLKEFSAHLSEMFKIDIAPTLFFECSDIRGLSAYFLEEHEEKVNCYYSQFDTDRKETNENSKAEKEPVPPGFKVATRDLNILRTVPHEIKDIAIIGAHGVFPGSKDLSAFWENLRLEKHLIAEIPQERWNWEDFYDPTNLSETKTNSKWGGFISDVDKFDCGFFNISPAEAEVMDPQQRLMLETTWRAIEDSGYRASSLAGKPVGVFVGVQFSDYQDLLSMTGKITAYMGTGNSHSILANRVSYFLDFKGPSEAINTACSSSLVAVHRAVKSIRDGESDIAIAGGVSLILSPYSVIGPGKLGVLSPEGKCKTFDADANGYVKGEGVGALVLKPLQHALKDNDHIYAVIKGTAENHGGKANSLTAPNSFAQAALLVKTYAEAGISPLSIGYIEVHGTGTELGDPVEVEGLKRAFKQLSKKTGIEISRHGYCGIGSVKTNIGHLEPASGIAGLMKVILAMKHKTLPGTLHLKNVNPYIQINDSPFYIVEKTKPWEKIVDEQGHTTPRRAGVSSFGFGGAYAHIALEEFELPKREIQDSNDIRDLQIIVLSAMDEARLKEYAQNMSAFLEKDMTGPYQVNLADMAYTLQVGREAMNCRLACVVKRAEDLADKLKQFGKGAKKFENLFWGAPAAVIPESDDVRSFIQRRDFNKIAQLWVAGVEIDWADLNSGIARQRIPLPTYPFARERYWIPEIDLNIKVSMLSASPSTALHPFVGINTSTLQEQKFTTRFTGTEFFFSDHVIAGQRLFPGVAYVEMARAAGNLAGMKHIRRISNIVWQQPILAADGPFDVHIGLYASQTQAEYEIFSIDSSGKRLLHGQGKLISEPIERPSIEKIDIEMIKKRCQESTRSECYDMFKKVGMEYGAAFQPIQVLYSNEHEALSQLNLPNHLRAGLHELELHPSLMDGALQTITGIMAHGVKDEKAALALPFAVGHIDIFSELSEACYAYATLSSRASTIEKYNIRLIDEAGNCLVNITDFSVRAVHSQTEEGRPLSCMYFGQEWEKSDFLPDFAREHQQVILIFDFDSELYDRVKHKFKDQDNPPTIIFVKHGNEFKKHDEFHYEINIANPADNALFLQDIDIKSVQPIDIVYKGYEAPLEEAALDDYLKYGGYALLHLSQALMALKIKNQIRLIYVYHTTQPCHAAIAGFAKTIRLENPKYSYKTVQFQDRSIAPSQFDTVLLNEFNRWDAIAVRYANGQRLIKKIRELDADAPEPVTKIKKRGVYLITGGLGGLGFVFAGYLAREAKARLVLVGRSALTLEMQEKIGTLEFYGAEVVYIKGDVADRQAVQTVRSEVEKHFGTLHGIIHSAGTIDDSVVINKTVSQMTSVLSAKVHGTVYLDAVFQDQALDFFVLFSSAASVFGNVGQSDYAYANSFLDHFAENREAQRDHNKRSGRTVAINWPLWKEGGMKSDKNTQVWMEKNLGIKPLSTSNGISAFQASLGLNVPQLIVIEGEAQKVKNLIGAINLQPAISKEKSVSSAIPLNDKAALDLKEKTVSFFKQIVSQTTKLPLGKIDAEASFEKFGIDSVMIINITRKLEDTFGELSKTLFFEYQSLEELSEYFVEEHGMRLKELFGQKGQNREIISPDSEPAHEFISTGLSTRNRFMQPAAPNSKPRESEAIAIIGVSGRFPKARNMDEFWDNLRFGRDCIEEIPAARWDYHQYFDPKMQGIARTYSKWGGFIDDMDMFDAMFFNITPREAEFIDPQERLFLETTWESIENSGYSKSSLSGQKVSVFCGVMYGEYQLFGTEAFLRGEELTGTSSFASIANRVSYFFNFIGPSITLDTMCSSSLTAIHLASESLKRRESDLSIAGGVNLSIHPKKYIILSHSKFISSDGRCRSFGEGGDGYVPGEGVGAVVLKRLSQAISDNDFIYAVIRGTSVNHGGKTNAYSTPNPVAQGELVKEAFEKAKINPITISYIEAHGTGTALGDPIEIRGLNRAFKEYNIPRQHCAIGSVKSNIGHLESAAGIAALAKVLLQMKHRQLVPSIHSEPANPHINFETSPFFVQKELSTWKQPRLTINGAIRTYPRRAGISSFGAGGANAHIILEEYPYPPATEQISSEYHIVVLSAKSKERLDAYARRLLDFLEREVAISLANLAVTLQVGREMMEERLAIVVQSIESLKAELTAYLQGKDSEKQFKGNIEHSGTGPGLMIKGEEGQEFIQKVIANKKYDLVAQIWVSGSDIDWLVFYPNRNFQRIPLPTYPFDKQRCWIPQLSSPNQTLSEKNRLSDISTEPAVEPAPELASGVMPPFAENEEENKKEKATLNETAAQQVKDLISKVTKIPVERININDPLDIYGLNSVMTMGMTLELEKIFGPLSKTLFFEYKTLADLISYFVEDHAATLSAYFTGASQGAEVESLEKTLQSSDLSNEKPVTLLLGRFEWEEEAVFDDGAAVLALKEDECVLLFDTGEKLQNDLQKHAESASVILVQQGERFRVESRVKYTINPIIPEEYNRLWASLANRDLKPAFIIHRWSDKALSWNMEKVHAQVKNSFLPIFYLSRTLIDRQLKNKIKLLYVYPRLGGNTQPQYSAISGFAKTAMQENPWLQIKTLELCSAGNDDLFPDQTESILKELSRPTDVHLEVRHHAGKRWVKRFKPFDAEPAQAQDRGGERPQKVSFKDGGVYLITGGTGYLGFVFAEYIARHVKAKLVLVGRSDLNPSRVQRIEKIESLGSEILYIKADIAKVEDTVKVIEAVNAECGRINGIIHSAGVIRDAFILKKTQKEIEAVLAPKVYGAINLDAATKNEALDFLVLFSSTTAAFGNIGQSDYAYANSFLDDFARYRTSLIKSGLRSGKTLSINWPLWEEGGMQITEIDRKILRTQTGLLPLPTNAALSAWESVASLNATQFIVLYGDADRFKEMIAAQRTHFEETKPVIKKEDKTLIHHMSNDGKAMKTLEISPSQQAVPKSDLNKTMAASNENRVIVSSDRRHRRKEIAIIGMSGRFPNAPDVYTYWQNLKSGKRSITGIPPERWDSGLFSDPDADNAAVGRMYCQLGGFLEDADKFDPLFFNMSPIEAEGLDPQERIFLETAWATFEDGGYSRDRIKDEIHGPKKGEVGIFAGVTTNSYMLWGPQEFMHGNLMFPTAQPWSVANRVSYIYDINGPSVPVDTACSSSLTAVHQACESIMSGESYLAIAGGVNLYTHPFKYVGLCLAGMLSRKDRCDSYGNQADGFIPGEGVGAILLKPFADAVKDGDTIYGVITGSAVNHGGRSKSYTAPNPVAHAQVISKAIEDSAIHPRTISYIEGHGTGTELGDPIEVRGLSQAFQKYTSDCGYCALGAVKPNIGHSESAAGISGLIKVLLQLKHKQIAPTMSSRENNPNIDFENSPFYVQRDLTEWKQPVLEEEGQLKAYPRRAGVNSFGAGGANAHIIVEEYIPEDVRKPYEIQSSTPQLIVLSAKNVSRLKAYIEKFDVYLKQQDGRRHLLPDIAHTLQIGREHMAERFAVIVSSIDALKEILSKSLSSDLEAEGIFRGNILKDKDQSPPDEVTLNQWLKAKELKQLAQAWVKGASVPFRGLHDRGAHTLSLPTYPFERNSYWIKITELSEEEQAVIKQKVKDKMLQGTKDSKRKPKRKRQSATKPAQNDPVFADNANESEHQQEQQTKYLTNQWLPSDYRPETNRDDFSESGPVNHILIFDVDKGLYHQWNESVPNVQATLLFVKPGASFSQKSEQEFEVNPAAEADYFKLVETLNNQGRIPQRIVFNWSKETFDWQPEAMQYQLHKSVYAVLYLCKAYMNTCSQVKAKILFVYQKLSVPEFSDSKFVEVQPHYSALSGVAKSIPQENPMLGIKTLELEEGESNRAEIVKREVLDDGDLNLSVAYRSGQRFVRQSQEFVSGIETPDQRLKNGGVYLITGGAGGLGLIFSKYIAETVNATLVLTGRSALKPATKEVLVKIKESGSNVVYMQSDVSVRQDAIDLIHTIKTNYGRLDGIIHCAGVIRDAMIMNKTTNEIDQVLSTKIFGTLNLDEATKNENLDLMVLFSSTAATFGNAGQSDYAYANSFLDDFAACRNQLVTAGRRSGKTLAINWPYWKEGGMQIAGEKIMAVERITGLAPMPTSVGIRTWEVGLSSEVSQLAVVYGDLDRFAAILNPKAVKKKPPKKKAVAKKALSGKTYSKEELSEKVLRLMIEFVSEAIKLPEDQIDPDMPFQEFGIDSIMITNFNMAMEQEFGNISKTIMFESKNLNELKENLIRDHRDELIAYLEEEGGEADDFEADALADETEDTPDMDSEQVSTAPSRSAHAEPIQFQPVAPAPEALAPAEGISIGALKRAPKEIAIIGVAGIYPDARDIREFWQNLKAGKDSVREVTPAKWNFDGTYNENIIATFIAGNYCKSGGYLYDVSSFDPLFFKISPKEARNIDPQERLFLEVVWHTLEDAGYTKQSLKNYVRRENDGDIGVYVGITTISYILQGAIEWNKGNYVTPNSMPWSIANRVSFFFDWQGPSMPVDTACSSALTALHQACRSIKDGECSMAVVGGVNLYLHLSKIGYLCDSQMLSHTGKCRSFGEGADGFVPGEGAGAVLLKPLAKAVRDKDNVYAVIKSTAINHCGQTNGYNVPSPNAQADLIRQALRRADIDPRTIGYIEAHGTGTALGDPIEIAGLTKAYHDYTRDKQYCAIGSCKSNIGHLESAAGIAGLTKVLMQMKYKKLVPSLHAEKPNKNINFESSPFYVQKRLAHWHPITTHQNGQVVRHPRRAGLSSFGAGGANAHIILEEYRGKDTEAELQQRQKENREHLIVLSAKERGQLEKVAGNLLGAMPKGQPDTTADAEAYIERAVTHTLKNIVRQLTDFSMADIDTNENLADYGVDPTVLVKFVDAIDHTFDLDIDLEPFFNLDSIHSVAAYLIKEHKEHLGNVWIKSNPEIPPLNESDPDAIHETIENIAYTLQTGREAMPERIALIVRNKSELKKKLAAFLDNRLALEGMYYGNSSNETLKSTLLYDDDVNDLIIKWFQKGKLRKVATLWVQGIDLDWQALYRNNQTVRKISLPTYPFKKEICWIKTIRDADPAPAPQVEQAAHERPDEFSLDKPEKDRTTDFIIEPEGQKVPIQEEQKKELFTESADSRFYYKPKWVESPLNQQLAGMAEIAEQQRNENKINLTLYTEEGRDLADALCGKHPDNIMIKVLLGSENRQIGDNVLTIKVDDMDAWDNLFNHYSKNIGIIYFLGGIQKSKTDVSNLDAFAKSQKKGVLTLFNLFKSLSRLELDQFGVRIKVVTNDVYQVQPQEETNPFAGSLPGLTKSAIKEYKNIEISCLDISLKNMDGDNQVQWNQLVESIIREPRHFIGEEVAVRGGCRYVRVLEKIDLPPLDQIPFKKRGVYMIIGGAGGIGLEVSRYLAEGVQAKLVWIGRSALTQSQKENIEQIEAVGGEVAYIRSDVTHLDEMTRAVADVKQQFGRINGVIHSAVVLRDRILALMDKEAFCAALKPKVHGSVILSNALGEEPLDFLLFFSSIQSITGDPGLSNYAAGCTFKDAFAIYLNANKPYPVKVINWGYWGSVGVTATEDHNRRLAARGVISIKTQEGMEALTRIVGSDYPQVVPFKARNYVLKSMGVEGIPDSSEPLQETQKALPAIDIAKIHQNQVRMIVNEKQHDRRLTLISQYNCGLISKILEIPPGKIENRETFINMGLDSIMAIEIRNFIKNDFNLDVALITLLEDCSIASLSTLLNEKLKKGLFDKEEGNPKYEAVAGQEDDPEQQIIEGEL